MSSALMDAGTRSNVASKMREEIGSVSLSAMRAASIHKQFNITRRIAFENGADTGGIDRYV